MVSILTYADKFVSTNLIASGCSSEINHSNFDRMPKNKWDKAVIWFDRFVNQSIKYQMVNIHWNNLSEFQPLTALCYQIIDQVLAAREGKFTDDKPLKVKTNLFLSTLESFVLVYFWKNWLFQSWISYLTQNWNLYPTNFLFFLFSLVQCYIQVRLC